MAEDENAKTKLSKMNTEFYQGGEERHLNTNYPSSEIVKAQILASVLGDPEGMDLPYQAKKADLIAAIMWSYSGPAEKEGIARRQSKEMFIGNYMQDDFRRMIGIQPIQEEKPEKGRVFRRKEK